MRIVGVFGRVGRLRRFRNAGFLARNGQFRQAREIIDRLILERPSSSVCTILLADTHLFEDEFQIAMSKYCLAVQLVDLDKTLSGEDSVFLSAYINFRKLAISHKLGKNKFLNWRDAAKEINRLPAKKIWKEVFILPT